MSERERDLHRTLLTSPAPEELEAQRRAWSVVRAAYTEREVVPRRRSVRPLVALAVLAALLTAALSPPGQAVADWVRDSVAENETVRPALFRLPADGRLLVVSERGPWIVQMNGSKRLLGSYEGADFSPRGKFVVVTRERSVTAVEPLTGNPRWSISRPQAIAQGRWAPGRFRVAYRSGGTLRVVDGNGTDDRLLAPEVAPIAPAWRPASGERNVLAYADAAGRVQVVDVDSRVTLWRTGPVSRVREVRWSSDGQLLLVVTRTGVHPIFDTQGRVARTLKLPRGHVLLDVDFSPSGQRLAYTDFDPATGQGSVIVDNGTRARTLQSGESRLEDVAWSPNGRWLLVGRPDADQWLFLRLLGGGKIDVVDDIRREFDPGGEGTGEFPRIAGWCCAP